ncbi:MAG: hypothetical protein CFE25_06760 [Chitinophagaceae bacterium BSSC1]|nr:MAG: hypothetical protein CFE25_06760 [Chitinophagaceae bacterium BSSC1]
MNYIDFNSKVLDFYLKRSNGEFFNLSIDVIEFESIISISEIHNFKLLQNNWDKLFAYNNEIPMYIGLLSIQCLAASLMQNDNLSTASNYQIRLCQLLGIRDNIDLQILFRGKNHTSPIQEIIWEDAKSYFNKKHSLILKLPPKTFYAGRFVQYPKSQCLLKFEDLKRITIFFSEEFKVHELLPYNYFKNIIETNLTNIDISNIGLNKLLDAEYSEDCFKQIFNFYISWDGTIYKHKTPLKQLSNKRDLKTAENDLKLILIISESAQYYIVNDKMNEVKEINKQNIFSIPNYKYIHTGVIFFNQIESYEQEYEESRFIYSSQTVFILIDKITNSSITNYLLKFSELIESINERVFLFKFNEIMYENSPLKKYISPPLPIKLKYGLKLGRRNEYIKNYGPTITGESKWNVIYKNNKIEYNPKIAEVGDYKIRVSNYPDIKFSIIEKTKLEITINSKTLGWNLTNYELSENYHIEGNSIILKNENNNLIREWIKLNTSSKKFKSTNDNLLFSILKHK